MLLLRHALAFAADQNPGHLMGGLTRSGEIAVRSVPARVIGIVPGGASFAGTALSTGCAVQNRFVRARTKRFCTAHPVDSAVPAKDAPPGTIPITRAGTDRTAISPERVRPPIRCPGF